MATKNAARRLAPARRRVTATAAPAPQSSPSQPGHQNSSVFKGMERLRYQGGISDEALRRFAVQVGNRYFAIDLPPAFWFAVRGYLDATSAPNHRLFEAALECEVPAANVVLAFECSIPGLRNGPTHILDPLLAAVILERRVTTGFHSDEHVLFTGDALQRYQHLAARTISGAYNDEGCYNLCRALVSTDQYQPAQAVALLRTYLESGALPQSVCAA